jgi:hypothetical protein
VLMYRRRRPWCLVWVDLGFYISVTVRLTRTKLGTGAKDARERRRRQGNWDQGLPVDFTAVSRSRGLDRYTLHGQSWTELSARCCHDGGVSTGRGLTSGHT